jgi:hypothetical protein
MWFFFFILAIFGVIALLFYLIVQLNELEKQVATLTERIKKHYGAG